MDKKPKPQKPEKGKKTERLKDLEPRKDPAGGVKPRHL
jgi:hypothetical protein